MFSETNERLLSSKFIYELGLNYESKRRLFLYEIDIKPVSFLTILGRLFQNAFLFLNYIFNGFFVDPNKL